jgi:hypothetical protein
LIFGALAASPVPAKACLFIHNFEKASKSSETVSLLERVVYSLIAAGNQAVNAKS